MLALARDVVVVDGARGGGVHPPDGKSCRGVYHSRVPSIGDSELLGSCEDPSILRVPDRQQALPQGPEKSVVMDHCV